MLEFEKNLKQFREDRNLLTYNHDVFIKMVTEELDEVLTADNWNDRVGEMCDVCVLVYNAIAQRGEVYIKDIHTDKTLKPYTNAVEFCKSALDTVSNYLVIDAMRDCITLNGYDFDKAMLETSKKILSREGAMNEVTGKWTKSKTQSKETLYVPNYEGCKL